MGGIGRYEDAHYNAMFHGFVGTEGKIKGETRQESLRRVKRWFFEDIPGRLPLEPFFYRRNLEDHAQEVSWIVAELLPYAERAYPGYFTLERQKEALTLALVHDDLEILTGDESSHQKEVNKGKQLKLWNKMELEAVDELARQYPETVNGFNYRDLLLADLSRETLTSQLVSVADKVVGLGEALGEAYAGNPAIIVDPNAESNRPIQGYIEQRFWKKEEAKDWSLMGPLFRRNHPFLNRPERLTREDVVKIVEKGMTLTEETIGQPTGNPFYDKYREVILERGGRRGLELLVTKKEPKKESESVEDHPYR